MGWVYPASHGLNLRSKERRLNQRLHSRRGNREINNLARLALHIELNGAAAHGAIFNGRVVPLKRVDANHDRFAAVRAVCIKSGDDFHGSKATTEPGVWEWLSFRSHGAVVGSGLCYSLGKNQLASSLCLDRG